MANPGAADAAAREALMSDLRTPAVNDALMSAPCLLDAARQKRKWEEVPDSAPPRKAGPSAGSSSQHAPRADNCAGRHSVDGIHAGGASEGGVRGDVNVTGTQKAEDGTHEEVCAMEDEMVGAVRDTGVEAARRGRIALNLPERIFVGHTLVLSDDARASHAAQARAARLFLAGFKAYVSSLAIAEGRDARLFLSSDRHALLDDYLLLIYAQSASELDGNDTSRLITGPKGCGKTSCLQAIVSAAAAFMPNYLAVYADVSSSEIPRVPSAILATSFFRLTSQELVPASDVRDLVKVLRALRARGWRALLLLDEYQELYGCPATDADARLALDQTSSLVNDAGDTVLVGVSGGSTYLSDLCFGKHPKEDPTYPLYRGTAGNLKQTRTLALFLGPMATRGDLVGFVKATGMLSRDDFARLTRKEELDAFHLVTGGVPRVVNAVLRLMVCSDDFSSGTASDDYVGPDKLQALARDTALRPLLRLLLEALAVANVDSDEMWGWLKRVPLARLEELRANIIASKHTPILVRLTPEEAAGVRLDCKTLNTAAEEGVLWCLDTSEMSEVRFVSPILVAMLLRGESEPPHVDWFGMYHRVCLWYPHSILGTDAKAIFRRGLCENGLAAVNVAPKTPFADIVLRLSYNADAERVTNAHIAGRKCTPSVWDAHRGKPLIESPNASGADIVVLGDGVMHRIQLELGRTPICQKEAERTVAKLAKGQAVAEGLGRLRKPPIRLATYIATTRRLTPNAAAAFAAAGVTVLDRTAIYAVWPKCVREWAATQRDSMIIPGSD